VTGLVVLFIVLVTVTMTFLVLALIAAFAGQDQVAVIGVVGTSLGVVGYTVVACIAIVTG
jgi:hypothetical protein